MFLKMRAIIGELTDKCKKLTNSWFYGYNYTCCGILSVLQLENKYGLNNDHSKKLVEILFRLYQIFRICSSQHISF